LAEEMSAANCPSLATPNWSTEVCTITGQPTTAPSAGPPSWYPE
jgi:hypothetical protein